MKLYCNVTPKDFLIIEDYDVDIKLIQYADGVSAIILNRENVKQLVATLLKYLDKPTKVEGWVNVYDDGSTGGIFSSEYEARQGIVNESTRQVQVREV